MTIQNDNDLYRTSDLALATALSLWLPMQDIDKSNPRKAQFLFIQNDKLYELIKKYWRGKLKVEPLAYFNQLRVIKARLYE